jgi:hypothetical protein
MNLSPPPLLRHKIFMNPKDLPSPRCQTAREFPIDVWATLYEAISRTMKIR